MSETYIHLGLKIGAWFIVGWLIMTAVANNEIPIKQTGIGIMLWFAVVIIVSTYRRNERPTSARKRKPNEPETATDDDEPEYQPRVRVTGESD